MRHSHTAASRGRILSKGQCRIVVLSAQSWAIDQSAQGHTPASSLRDDKLRLDQSCRSGRPDKEANWWLFSGVVGA